MRAALSSDFQVLRSLLQDLFPNLAGNCPGYASIYAEKKETFTASVNPKQSQVQRQQIAGVVFRMHAGGTLFEEATDCLDQEALEGAIKRLQARVKATPPSRPAQPTYVPPSWKERLATPLEAEILSQLPSPLEAHTPVHFGLRFLKDPRQEGPEETLLRLRSLLQTVQQLAPQAGLTPEQLSFMVARQGFAQEESLFLDAQSNLSQTLYRLSLSLIVMSGAERTFLRVGGLGGLECLDYTEADLLNLLRDLKALGQTQRLSPGKHRVLFGPAVSGVLAHEAFGHSQEGDTCARGRSKAWELSQQGTRVGNELATILNNPALYEHGGHPYAAWGSYFFDEEGWLAQSQVLLDRGRLQPPMTHLCSALQLKVPRSANGKRENWSHGVYTRQTNTYFTPGTRTFEELMAELGDGYLAMHPAGGMEDPKGMGIQVGLAYLYEVKQGKRTGRVFKGPAGGDIQMTGFTPDVLEAILDKSKIEAHHKGPDQARHPLQDVGGCGKYHKEFVYAGCGGPFMLLDPVLLG